MSDYPHLQRGCGGGKGSQECGQQAIFRFDLAIPSKFNHSVIDSVLLEIPAAAFMGALAC